MSAGDCKCQAGGSRDPQELLCELFDAETTPARAAAIRRELATCPECQRRFESEQAVRVLVRDCCGRAQAPQPLRERIVTSLTSVTYTEIRYL